MQCPQVELGCIWAQYVGSLKLVRGLFACKSCISSSLLGRIILSGEIKEHASMSSFGPEEVLSGIVWIRISADPYPTCILRHDGRHPLESV